MTERADKINCLARHVADSGRTDIKMAASELMDLNAELAFIGRWYEANIEPRSIRVERLWWGDIERKVAAILKDRAEIAEWKRRKSERANNAGTAGAEEASPMNTTGKTLTAKVRCLECDYEDFRIAYACVDGVHYMVDDETCERCNGDIEVIEPPAARLLDAASEASNRADLEARLAAEDEAIAAVVAKGGGRFEDMVYTGPDPEDARRLLARAYTLLGDPRLDGDGHELRVLISAELALEDCDCNGLEALCEDCGGLGVRPREES